MEKEPGDDYVRRFAAIVRAHEQRLANASSRKGVGSPGGYLNPLRWVGWDSQVSTPSPRRAPPTLLQLDLHHLYYLLIRFEGLGIPVGSLDIRLRGISRPTSRISMIDKSDAMSMSSFTSALSAVSKLNLGASWFGRIERPIDNEIKYTYSAFTVLPALSIRQGDFHVISELADDPPVDNAVPMYAFKNLTTLELLDVDPHVLFGWDQLSESLRSLTIKRGGIDDVTNLFVDSVLDDQARRDGNEASSPLASPRQLAPSRFASGRFRHGRSISVPTSVQEDEPIESQLPVNQSTPPPKLPPRKWRMLRHLCLADNAMTFFPTTPLDSLTSLTHLDLSNNLLVSVPPGLSALYNLVSLNLADNMINSVLGIYAHLGQVLTINLCNNRLENICGLERLVALERVDLRGNLIQDPGEIGRLALLPNIAEIRVNGNPMVTMDEQYRVHIFELFAHESKSILLDDAAPSFLEARNMPRTRSPHQDSHAPVGSPSSSPVSRQPKKKKQRRLVDLDGSHTDGNYSDTSTMRDPSEASPPAESQSVEPVIFVRPSNKTRKSRHTRYSTEGNPAVSEGVAHRRNTATSMATLNGPNRRSTVVEAGEGGDAEAGPMSHADAYRARIDALRREVGDSWLKVLSQSSGLSSGVPAPVS